MVDMGAEVGHKMRSAIKAKLTELDCYVDDELPDYIMVMVANKRTKSQMNEDLNLFLNTKTTTFVDWLHIVLKKLKEVTVTNLEVYKKASKRKSSELSIKVKKEKRIKKEKILKLDDDSIVKQEKEKVINKSLTDDLPLNVKSLSENRKILVVSNILSEDNMSQKLDKTFDIPSVSEVDQSNLEELEEIENQIKSVKNRLGLKVDDDVEEAELRRLVENSRNKSKEQLFQMDTSNIEKKSLNNGRHIELDISKTIHASPEEELSVEETIMEPIDWEQESPNEQVCLKKKEHSRIIFSKNDFQFTPSSPSRRKSVLDRLGKYSNIKEKSVMARLGRLTESNEKGQDREDSFMKECTSEDIKNKKNDDEDYYLQNNEGHYVQRRNKDNSNTRVHNSRKDQFGKKVGNKFRTNESSFRRSRDDLRKYLLKSAPSATLRKDIKKRLGLSSKVTVPEIDPQLLEDTFKKREVVSVVKVKPRILPPNLQQANKNLLLKAVADAQKSVAQSKPVGNNLKKNIIEKKYKTSEVENPPDALYTKQYKLNESQRRLKKISIQEKEKLRCLLSSHKSLGREFSEDKKGDQVYIPEPIKHSLSNVEYVPSVVGTKKTEESGSYIGQHHKFIVTLDGIEKKNIGKISVKERLHGRKTPSPIIFKNNMSSSIHLSESPEENKNKLPEKLKLVLMSTTKVKEKCKYFPLCRNGEDCEFYHPNRNCEQFPYCKFGEKCVYSHPSCKFGTSCTRRGCPYSHSSYLKQTPTSAVPIVPVKHQVQNLQICKYYPNCINSTCSFFHPKACKYGKYCKNQSICNYSHCAVPNKSSLTWKSK